MDGLTEVQKEILIILLIAVVVLLLTCFISYVVWKKVCLKEIQRQEVRHREQESDADFEDDLERLGIRRHTGGRNANGPLPVAPLYPNLLANNYNAMDSTWSPGQEEDQSDPFRRTDWNPTAPSLGSFNSRSSTTVASTTCPTTDTSAVSGNQSLENVTGDFQPNHTHRLPTYQELMQQRGHFG